MGGPKVQDKTNKRHFREYCNFTVPAKVYQARKRLKDKCIAWRLGTDQNEPRYRADDEDDYDEDENPQDPPSTPPSPTPERRPEPPQEADFVNEVTHIFRTMSVAHKSYCLAYKMVWLQTMTNWKATGEKELVFDFLAPPFSLNKFDMKVSDDGNFLNYAVRIPGAFFDPVERMAHPGTEESMRGTCGEIFKNEPNSQDGVLSETVQVGPLPFKVESAIRSVELVVELEADHELYRHLREKGVPKGSCTQIPLVLRVVLVSQEKVVGQAERSLKIKPGVFTPPRGLGGDDDDDSSGGGGGGGNPLSAIGGPEGLAAMIVEAARRATREELRRSGGHGRGPRTPDSASSFKTASETHDDNGGDGMSVVTSDSVADQRRRQRDRRTISRTKSEKEDPTKRRDA